MNYCHEFWISLVFVFYSLSCLTPARSGDAQYVFRFPAAMVCLYLGDEVDVTISVESVECRVSEDLQTWLPAIPYETSLVRT